MEFITNRMGDQYQTIGATNTSTSSLFNVIPQTNPRKRRLCGVITLTIFFAFLAIKIIQTQTPNNVKTIKKDNLILPSGVNLGSWLSLEDYFFAGLGSVEVATPTNFTAGKCLPPLHIGPSTGPKWNSETDLLYNLWKSTSLANALRVVHAHRTSFVADDDLERLSDLGVKNVRVPISWCLTDADPRLLRDETEEGELVEKFTCRDPFYDEVYWPAVPKSLLINFLERCDYYGIKAVLDIHTYPGATSIGTFSGKLIF